LPVLALLALLVSTGCATLTTSSDQGWSGAAAQGWDDANPGEAARPDQDPVYDVLVGQLHEREGDGAAALAAFQRAAAKDPDSAYLQRKLAEGLARETRLDDALVHAERARELDPDDVETRIFLARVYRMQRRPSDAESVLVDASGDPIDEMAGFLLHQILIESDRPQRALEIADWLLERDPDSLRAQLAKAAAYQKLGEPLLAEDVLRTSLELAPGNPRVAGALARSYRERGEHAAEIELYRELLELHPHHHFTLIALAEAQMSHDDLAGAISTFEEIEKYHPNDLRSVVRLGFLKFEAREWEEAGARFERFLRANPEEYDVAYFLGRVKRRAGDEEGAIEIFESIPESHRNYADARTELAAIYERRSDYEAALAEIELAAQASPSRALDLYSAQLRAKAGDFEGAVAHLEGLLLQEPKDDELLYNLGVVYGEAKRVDESIEYMQRALDENPDNASALNYMGYVWAERGVNLDEAEDLIERALEIRPHDGYITDSLGWVYYMRARELMESGRRGEAMTELERAREQLERAEKLTGGDPVVAEHLGDIFLLKGDRERALREFERAVELDPRPNEQPNLFQKLDDLRREQR